MLTSIIRKFQSLFQKKEESDLFEQAINMSFRNSDMSGSDLMSHGSSLLQSSYDDTEDLHWQQQQMFHDFEEQNRMFDEQNRLFEEQNRQMEDMNDAFDPYTNPGQDFVVDEVYHGHDHFD